MCAWYATWVFLYMNGHPLDAGFDADADADADEVVDVAVIAGRLRALTGRAKGT